jgi:hypothetical protein
VLVPLAAATAATLIAVTMTMVVYRNYRGRCAPGGVPAANRSSVHVL